MKKYVLLGVIALVAMLVSIVPVMATPTDSAEITAEGTIVQQLSISTDTTAIAFKDFQLGINEQDNIGTITVVSAFVPNWKVTAALTDGYGFMRLPIADGYAKPLTNPLEQYNYKAGTPGWVNAHGLTFSGSASTTMSESFRQNVLISDTPGTYSATIIYTIAAV